MAMMLIPPVWSAPMSFSTEDPAAVLLDEILALQAPDGAFPAEPGGGIANVDSGLLYLLTGIAEQARLRDDPRLWLAVERGLVWLADRQWGEDSPLPDAFPDALPMEGAGRPMGDPPVAAIGATAARFVALVGLLPAAHPRLHVAAKRAWRGLQRHNLDPRGFLWNAWICSPQGQWQRRPIRYAADQADFRVGQIGAVRLGLPGADHNPFAHFPLGSLAMNASGGLETLAPDAVQGAWAVLAFDGPPTWRKEALRRLKRLDQGNSYLVNICARAANGDPVAGARLVRHLRLHGLPTDRDKPGSPVYTSIAGFALRALARMSMQRIRRTPALKPRHTAQPHRVPASTAHPERN